ncbi:diguanylate cyclase [bacterium]|nr:diguanylate cyclase [bacterium]MBU1994710.1 diguanylate cyclase [bacterium]
MQFIEALRLRSKLFFLFVLITVGLITVGIMGTLNIDSMKRNLDSLYFGSLVPVTELNEILQTYHGDLTSTIYKAKNYEISPSQTNLQLNNSLLKIEKYWKSYESHFKRADELEYVEYVAIEIQGTNDYFKKVLQANIDGKDLKNISIELLEKHVLHIHNILKKLIKYEIGMAKYERNRFLEKYNSTLTEVGIFLIVIILAVLVISFYVFKSIQNDHTRLEIITKKLKRVNKKLENVSYTDSLTSLHNRRYFNFIYDRELKRAKRIHSYITFMMLDIDYFKQYNDRYGHIEGDYALKSVAKVLNDTLKRPSDFVFRLGGEEFGVLLVDTDEASSIALAQKICDSVRERQIVHEWSKVNDFVTISIGLVCCIADDALDENALISRADKMLYEAKEGGRNRYVIATDITEANTKVIEALSA